MVQEAEHVTPDRALKRHLRFPNSCTVTMTPVQVVKLLGKWSLIRITAHYLQQMRLKSSISNRIFFKTETLYSIDFETLINWWSYQISLEKIHKNNLERNSREKQRWLPLWKNHIVNSSLSSLHIALWNWWPSFFPEKRKKYRPEQMTKCNLYQPKYSL